jgi:hypothetical protein
MYLLYVELGEGQNRLYECDTVKKVILLCSSEAVKSYRCWKPTLELRVKDGYLQPTSGGTSD